MKTRILIVGALLCPLVLNSLPAANAAGTGDSKQFTFIGRFILGGPCKLDLQTTDIKLDFSTVVKKDLYLHTRTSAIPFTIKLTDCDTTKAEQVAITFGGTESTALPGALAVTGQATGVAIGMEKPDGTPLPFNKATPGYTLVNGTNDITLQAYVIGEPNAITAQTIAAGDFTATATFELAYP